MEERNIGWAVQQMKAGNKVQREGWNGKGMYLAYQEGSVIPAELARGGAAKSVAEEGVEQITIHPHISMRAADQSVFCWNPNNLDMLATDWQLVD